MERKLIDAIVGYVDKKIQYELICMEVGADGYYSSHITERKIMEKALRDIYLAGGLNDQVK